jgi:hypothetical protein
MGFKSFHLLPQTEILRLYGEGLTGCEIARQLSICQDYISRYLRTQGLYGRNYRYVQEFSIAQRDLITGMLLGDGGLWKPPGKGNCSLSMCHCAAQKSWAEWKASQLGPLFKRKEATPYTNNHGKPSVQLSSRSHPFLLEFYELFYSRPDSECSLHVYKKRISPQILGSLGDLGLSVWFGDDGTVNHNNICLVLGAGLMSEYQAVQQWFVSKDYWSSMDDSNYRLGRNGVKLVFEPESSIRMREIFRANLPSCIGQKLRL